MQFKSSFARLAAFAFFLLSFTMLVCAAPAPVSNGLAVRGESLAARGDSLVARTDGNQQCKDILADVKVKIDLAAVVQDIHLA